MIITNWRFFSIIESKAIFSAQRAVLSPECKPYNFINPTQRHSSALNFQLQRNDIFSFVTCTLMLSIFCCCIFLFFIHLFILISTLYIYYSSIGWYRYNKRQKHVPTTGRTVGIITNRREKYFYLFLYVCHFSILQGLHNRHSFHSL